MSHFQDLQNSATDFPGVSCQYTMKQKLSKAALDNTKVSPLHRWNTVSDFLLPQFYFLFSQQRKTIDT